MVYRESLFVTLVKLVDHLPFPSPPEKREVGRPREYSERLILKVLVIMIVRRLYSAYSLLAFLEQDTAMTCQLRQLLTNEESLSICYDLSKLKLPYPVPKSVQFFVRTTIHLNSPFTFCTKLG